MNSHNHFARSSSQQASRLLFRCVAALLALFSVIAFNPHAFAAVTTYTWLAGAAGNWNTTADWSPSPGANGPTGAGNIVQQTSSTGVNGTNPDTTLNVSGIVIGQVKNTPASGRIWTILDDANHFALTLDNSGGNANLLAGTTTNAAISTSSSGGMTFNPSIVIANTDLDIGALSSGNISVGVLNTNTITATSTRSLNFKGGSTGTVTVNSSIGSTGSNINISNLSAGAGAVTLSGALGASVASITQNTTTSLLKIGNANASYVGNTNISSGTIQATTSTTLGSVTLGLNATNGILDTLANSVTVSGLATGSGATAGSQTIGNSSTTGGGTLIYAGSGASSYGGLIVDKIGAGTKTMALTVNSGTLTLSGANTFTGVTTLSGGVLSVGSIGNGGVASSNLGSATNAAANLVFNGGTLQYTGASASTDRNFTINANKTATFDITNALTITGGSTATSGALTKIGAGTLTLGGSNSYTGNTTVSIGTLALGLASSTNNIASSPTITVASGATLDATGLSGGVIALGASQTLAGSGTVTGGATTVSGTHISPGVAGVSGGIGTLTLSTLALSSGSQLDFDIASTASLDQITVTGSGGLTINGGQLNINGAAGVFAANGVYNLIGFTGAIGGTGVSSLTLNNTNQDTLNKSYTFGASGGFVTLTVANSGATADVYLPDADGLYSVGSNWSLGAAPNAVGAFAAFGGAGSATLTQNRTITVDGAYTLGTLSFNSGNTFGFTLANGGAGLTLDNGAQTANVSDTAGSHSIQAPLTLTANGALFTVSSVADTLTVSGAIGSTLNTNAGITKAGNGVLALTGANTYFGGTTLNAGTVQINSDSSLGNVTGGVTINAATLEANGTFATSRTILLGSASSTIQVDPSMVYQINGALNDGAAIGTLNKTGAGTLTLTGANGYTGGTVISTGTLSISSNGNLGAEPTAAGVTFNGGTLLTTATMALDNGTNIRPITLSAGGGTFAQTGGTVLTVKGLIGGAGSLTESGAGTVILGSANNYGGNTLVSGGTLKNGILNALPTTTTLTLQGSGIYDLAGFGQTIAGLSDGGVNTGTITSSSGTPTLTIGNATANTFSGALTGGLGLTKSSGVLMTLSGANTYTGATTVNAGTVALTGSLGSVATPTGAVFVNAGAFNVNGGSLNAASLSQSGQGGSFALTGNGTVALTGTLAAGSTNASSGGLISLTSGTLSANAVTVGRGGLNNGATPPTAGSATEGIYVNGATVTIANTLGVGNNSATNSSANMRIDSGSVTVGGTTTVTNAANARFSVLDINGGTFTSNDTTGAGILVGGGQAIATIDAELLVRGTGTLNTNKITLGAAPQTGGLDQFTALGGTTYLGSGGIVAGGATGTTTTIVLGSSAVATAPVIGASADWSSSLPMTLTNSSTATPVTFQTADAGTNQHNITLNGALSGAGGLTKTGTGTLILTNTNTYTGLTTASNGAITAASDAALGNSAAATAGLSFNPTGGSTATVNFTSANPAIASLASSGAGASNVVLGNAATPSATTLSVGGNGASTTFAGVISDANTASAAIGNVTKAGGGTLTLTGVNTYTGVTTIIGGTLQLGNGTTDGTITNSSSIVNNAALVYNRSTGSSFTYANAITGTGTLNKTGAGTQVLTGSNTFSGATTITQGTLQAGAAGALGSGGAFNADNSVATAGTGTASITVGTGGTLALSGAGTLDRVNNTAQINLNGGTILLVHASPTNEGTGASVVKGGAANTANGGTTTGTSTVGMGALTLQSTSTIDFGSGGVGTLVFNTFTPGSGNTLNILSYTSTANPATLTSGVDNQDDRLIFMQDQSNNITNNAFNFGSGLQVSQIPLDTGFYEVTVTAVPETSTVLGGILIVGVLGWRMRRHIRHGLKRAILACAD